MPDKTHGVVIYDHPFEPRKPEEPWGRCKHCWGYEGTHAETTLRNDGPRPPYRCPRCVQLDAPVCTHAPEVVEAFLAEKPEREERPTPLPVAEIDLAEMQELVVKPQEEDLTCWKCKAAPGRKLAENGAVLCAACEQIMKP